MLDDLQVVQQLLGNLELPWEGTRAEADRERLRKLRGLRGPVLSLLSRAPGTRISMAAFCEACDDIFSTRTDRS
jgi:hypothetical protein